MSTTVVTTRITRKYLMGKSKDDLCDMIFLLMDQADKTKKEILACYQPVSETDDIGVSVTGWECTDPATMDLILDLLKG